MDDKKSRRVIKTEDAKNYFNEHPKIKLVAIGLALIAGVNLATPAIMMINSSLWNVLSGEGYFCEILHNINVGLSKIIGLTYPNLNSNGFDRPIIEGIFQFNDKSGTYTLMGKDGALALYNAAGAKLTTAALALGGIGSTIASKINKKKFKSQNNETEEEIINELIEELLESGMTREEAFRTITETSNKIDNMENNIRKK